jgi:hypothetical protein
MLGIGDILDSLPLWGVFVLTVLVALLAVEAGFRLGKLWQQRTHADKEGSVGAMAGATLGLLAFLLAFVTGMAMNRFEHRRALVVAEANAIGTAFLRAGFLDQPVRDESRALLGEYVDVRLEAHGAVSLEDVKTRSEQIQTELWTRAVAAVDDGNQTPIMGLYIASLNEMIDLHSERVVAIESSRIPITLWLDIYAVAFLTMILVGVQSSYGERRNWLGLVLLIFVFSAVLYLIVDLDRPAQGLLTISQKALLDLRAQINAFAP